MTLADLLDDAMGQLPEHRRKAVEDMVGKYGGTDTFRFTLALLAATDTRERRLVRLLLNEIEHLELD
jgi:hypothetical protein